MIVCIVGKGRVNPTRHRDTFVNFLLPTGFQVEKTITVSGSKIPGDLIDQPKQFTKRLLTRHYRETGRAFELDDPIPFTFPS